MTSRLLVVAVLCIGLVAGMATPSAADGVCKDGTRTAAFGQGACSHHGGVEYFLEDPSDPNSDRIYPDQKGGTGLELWLILMGGFAACLAIGERWTKGKRSRST